MMPRKAALTDDYAKVTGELNEMRRPKRPKFSWLFVIFMLALSALCAGLGYWQIQRLAEKEALIATVTDRISLDPVPVPPTAEWVGLDPEIYNYRPVTVTGEFQPEDTLFVFTALTDPVGTYQGAGYWVMTPFVTEGGGMIFVNRGFIPQQFKSVFDDADGIGAPPSGIVTLTGIARLPEAENAFTPGPETSTRVEYVRSIERMRDMLSGDYEPIAGFFIDQKAGAKDALPQGGETKLTFSNRHFEYALTWFALSAITFIMTLFWLIRLRRS